MTRLAIVDASPLYVAADVDDDDHGSSLEVLSSSGAGRGGGNDSLGRRLGAAAEATFLRGLGTLDVEAPSPDDYGRMAELVEHYADFPLGGTDASVVALAERLGAEVIVTLDRRHFASVRPRHREAFELLP